MTRKAVYRLSLQLARVGKTNGSIAWYHSMISYPVTVFSKLLSTFADSRETNIVQLHAKTYVL